MELYIPTNIYGMIIAEPLHLNRKTDGLFVFVVEMAASYFTLVANYILQAWLLYEIYCVNQGKIGEGGKCPQGVILQIVCVFIFEASVFNEVRSCTELFSLLYHAGGARGGYTKQEPAGAGAVLLEEKEQSVFGRFTKKIRPTPPPGMPQWNLHSMPRLYKVWTTLIAAIPKFLIVLFLAYQGGVFIALCETVDDIVLNTLAVNFIVDIDEILYTSFTSSATQFALEHAEAVEIEMSNKQRFAQWFLNTFVFPAVVFCSSLFLVWQSVHLLGCPEDEFMDLKVKYLKLVHMA